MDSGAERRHRFVIESTVLVQAMGTRNHALFEALSQDEQASLGLLCGCGCDAVIPDDHATRLLDLGLVEVSCGSVSPTRSGKHAWHSRPH